MEPRPRIRTIPPIRTLSEGRPPIRTIRPLKRTVHPGEQQQVAATPQRERPAIRTTDVGTPHVFHRTPFPEELLDMEIGSYDPATTPGPEDGVITFRDLRRYWRNANNQES